MVSGIGLLAPLGFATHQCRRPNVYGAFEDSQRPHPLLPLASPLVAPRCGGLVDRTDLLDERAWVVRLAPVLGLAARLEPEWLDVRTGHDEVTLDVA